MFFPPDTRSSFWCEGEKPQALWSLQTLANPMKEMLYKANDTDLVICSDVLNEVLSQTHPSTG